MHKGSKVKLWSQIKLTPYDVSDLQFTHTFDNCQGTGRFWRIFLLRGHISYGRQPASVYNNIGCCKRSARTRTVPGRFYKNETNFRVQWCTHYYQNSLSFLKKKNKQVGKIRKTKADSNSVGNVFIFLVFKNEISM